MGFESSTNSSHNRVFDRYYELLEIVGRGRNSVVYKARKLTSAPDADADESIVALKVLTGNSKNPEVNLQRMEREALALLSSRHENVVRLNDYVTTGELCYLSMEYAERGDLNDFLTQSIEPCSSALALKLIQQLLAGLDAIHRAGIIHRDIKPENLLLTKGGLLRIADFGIALLSTDEMVDDESERGIGTLDYLSPEYLEEGVCSFSMDIYAVGVTLYKLLTKDVPFVGTSFAAHIESKMTGERIPLSSYIEDERLDLLELLLDRSLALDPAERFQDAEEFLLAVEAVLRGEKPAARVSSYGTPTLNIAGTGQGFSFAGGLGAISKALLLPFRATFAGVSALVGLNKKASLAVAVAALSGIYLTNSGNLEDPVLSDFSSTEEVALLTGSEEVIEEAVVSVKEVASSHTFASLVGKTHLGVLRGFAERDADVPLLVKTQGERMTFVFGVPNSEPVVYDSREIGRKSSLDLKSPLGDVVLHLRGNGGAKTLTGTYSSPSTGREGVWILEN